MEICAVSRLIVLFLTTLTVAGCAGAYVAGDVGADHGNLSNLHAFLSPPPPTP